MEEQVNIPALGIICIHVHISKVLAFSGYKRPDLVGRDQFYGGGQLILEKCLEKYNNARLYQSVPQTDTGG